MLNLLSLLLWLINAVGTVGQFVGGGLLCDCVGNGGRAASTSTGVGDETYPAAMGNVCAPWDDQISWCTAPASGTKPSWCTSSWCYTDASCSGAVESNYLPGEPKLYYNYDNCGGVDTYTGVCGFDPKATGCGGSGRKDPHFKLPHGGRTDIRGEAGAIFNLLSAKNFSFNVLFEEDDFKWSRRTVHGSKIHAAYWTVRTSAANSRTVNIGVSIRSAQPKVEVTVDGKEHTSFVSKGRPLTIDNLQVIMSEGRKVVIKTERWETEAVVAPFPYAKELNKGKTLLDVAIKALYDADKDVVAPHGIIGQAYDGDDLAVDGATDKSSSAKAPTNEVEEMEETTKAQGEGAIEGKLADYKMGSAYATDFKFSRFDAIEAAHRDVSKLSGHKHHKSAPAGSAKVYSVVPDVMQTATAKSA